MESTTWEVICATITLAVPVVIGAISSLANGRRLTKLLARQRLADDLWDAVKRLQKKTRSAESNGDWYKPPDLG